MLCACARDCQMRFVRQSRTIGMSNLDRKTSLITDSTARNNRKHGMLLPDSIRCIICGLSNCSKTNALISLLESPHRMGFENLYVYSKSLHQPKYQYLKKLLVTMDEIRYYAFSDKEDVVSSIEALSNSIVVFDDVVCEKQDTMREYFALGRHCDVDCFYLSQIYAKIPKHLLHDNANLLLLFKQDDTNLRHVYNDHVNTDMLFEDFRVLCRDC